MRHFHFTFLVFSFLFFGFLSPINAQKLSKKEQQFWQALETNNINLIEKHLKKGVNTDIKNKNNYTPLYWSLKHSKYEIAEILLKNHAKINAQIYQNPTLPEGATLLMLACSGRNPQNIKIAEFLLTHGADPNLTIKAKNQTHGFSALDIAIFSRNYYVINLLVEHGANVNHQIMDNPRFGYFTPLGLALNQGVNSEFDEQTITFLVKNGANFKHKIPFANGNTVPYEVLFFSVKHQFPIQNTAKKLQEYGANFNLDVQLSNYEGKLFPFVAKYNTTEEIKALFACKINPNSQVISSENPEEIGFTALHFAIEKEQIKMAKYLLEAKVDTTIQAKNGKTALNIAREKGIFEQLFEPQKRESIITQANIPKFEADSLLKVLKRSSGTKKIDILNQLGKNYLKYYQLEEAEKYLVTALKSAQKINYLDGKAVTNLFLGNLYFKKTFYQPHITKKNESLFSIQEKYFNPKTDTTNYIPDEAYFNLIGKDLTYNIYSINKITKNKFKDEFEENITLYVKRKKFNVDYWKKYKEYCQKSAEIRITQNDFDKQIWGIQKLINTYNLTSGTYPKQEKLYFKWLKIREKEGDSQKTLWVLKKIVNVYFTQQKYEDAEPYIQKIITIYQANNEPENICRFFRDTKHNLRYSRTNPKSQFNVDSLNQIIQNQKFNYLQRAVKFCQDTNINEEFRQKIYAQLSQEYEKEITELKIKPESNYLFNQYIELLKLRNDINILVDGHFTIAYHLRDIPTLEIYLEKIAELLPKSTDSKKQKRHWIEYSNYYLYTLKSYVKSLEIKLLAYNKNLISLTETKHPIERMIFLKQGENQVPKCLEILDNFLKNHSKIEEQTWAYRYKSRLYQYAGNYQKSAENQVKSLTQNDKKNLIDFADAGFLFQKAKNKNEALNYFNKSLEISKKHLEFESKTPIHTLKIAFCYESFNELKKAEKYYIKSFETAKKNLGQSKGILERYVQNLHTAHEISMQVSEFYVRQNKKKQALKYANTSLKVAKTLPNEKIFSKAYKIKKSKELLQKLQSIKK